MFWRNYARWSQNWQFSSQPRLRRRWRSGLAWDLQHGRCQLSWGRRKPHRSAQLRGVGLVICVWIVWVTLCLWKSRLERQRAAMQMRKVLLGWETLLLVTASMWAGRLC